MKKREWTKVFLIVYAVLAAAGLAVLFIWRSRGYPCRQMAWALAYFLLCLAGVYVGCLGISNLIRYKMRYQDRSIAGGFTLLILYGVAAVTALCFTLPEKADIQNVRTEISNAVLFAREGKVFTQEEETASGEQTEEKEGEPEQAAPYEKVEDAYEKLYDEVFSMSYPSCTMQYNAKGNFYAILEEGLETYQGTPDVPYEVTVVYDRVSDDGQSYMFIQYKIYSAPEGTITNFGLRYCVNMYSGEIRAEEVPWGN